MAVAASPLIVLWAATTGACGLITTARALTRPPDGADLRLLAVAGFTTVPAFFHDVAISTLRIRSFTLLEHASAFGTVLVSWMLLKRFLHTGDELAARRRAGPPPAGSVGPTRRSGCSAAWPAPRADGWSCAASPPRS